MKTLSSVSLGGQLFKLSEEACSSEQFSYPFVMVDNNPIFNIEVSYGQVKSIESKRCAKLLESYYKSGKKFIVSDRRKRAKYPLKYNLSDIDLSLYDVSIVDIKGAYRVSVLPIDWENELPSFTILDLELAKNILTKAGVDFSTHQAFRIST